MSRRRRLARCYASWVRAGTRRFFVLTASLVALVGPAVGIAYLGAVSYQEDRGRVAARLADHAAAANALAAKVDATLRDAVHQVEEAAAAVDGAPPSVATAIQTPGSVSLNLVALDALANDGDWWTYAFVLSPDGSLAYPRSLDSRGAVADGRAPRSRGGAPRTCPERGFDACVREIRARRKRAGQLAAAIQNERFRCGDGAATCAERTRRRAQARTQLNQLSRFDDTGAEAQLALARLARGDGDLSAAAASYGQLAERFGSQQDIDGIEYGLWAALGKLEVQPRLAEVLDLYTRALDLTSPMPDALRLLIIDRCRAVAETLEASNADKAALFALEKKHAQLVAETARARRLAPELAEVVRAAGVSVRGRASAKVPGWHLGFVRRDDGLVFGIAVDASQLESSAAALPIVLDGVRGVWSARLAPGGVVPGADHWRVLATASIGETLPNVGLAVVQEPSAPDPLDEIVRTRSRRHLALTGALAAVLLFGVLATVRSASRARELARLKSDFVSTVSHELKTPLTSIRMFAEMLQQGVAGENPERRHRYQTIIVKESERLGLLIANLLDYAQIEKGTRRYAPSREDLEDVVAEAVEAFSRLRDGEGTEVVVTRGSDGNGDGALLAMLDREVVVQAVLNLLSNAAKYGGDAAIDVAVSGDETQVRVAVRDRGPGIPSAEQPKIFREFYRAPSAQASAVEGTGLGLALVRRHTEALGGEVSVNSRLGHGASFTMSFPRSRA